MRALLITTMTMAAALGCQSAAELPAGPGKHDDGTGPFDGSGFVADNGIPAADETGVCTGDLDCLTDEACAVWGGCDGDPCADDRCVSGRCRLVDVEGCDPGYTVSYTFSACCALRTLDVAPDGRLTFAVEGSDPFIYDFVTPGYLQSIVDRAAAVGFFGWEGERCVPGETAADFSLFMTDGSGGRTISCDDGVCVGRLCDVVDTVWAIMPPHWHDGCGCSP